MLMRSPTRWARPKLVRPPGFILPCRPVLATKVPTGDGWQHELKHDGFRIIAHKDGERVHLWSRNGRDRTGDFVAIADAVRGLPASRIVLDGEAIAHCLGGLPHFNRLLSGDGQASACLYAFDLICLEAQDLPGVELIGRRRMLQKALKKAGPALRFSEHLEGADGEPAPWGLRASSLKRVTSRYKSGSCVNCVRSRTRPMSGADAAQLLPALDQASHSLPARGRFPSRVGPARLAGEFRVGDGPDPRLAGAMLVLAHPANRATVDDREAVGARRRVREGPPPGDLGVRSHNRL